LEKYKIHREFHLSSVNWLGGKNSNLFLSYFLGAFMLLFAGGALLYIKRGVDEEEGQQKEQAKQ
jgi:hypothetical protein